MIATDMIRTRRSVRSFEDGPLGREYAEKIMAFAENADNPYGIAIDWHLLSAKKDGLKVPVITGTDTYIAGVMRKVPHGEEAFGWSFEKIVLYAWSLGVGTTWIAGTMDRGAFEKAVHLKDGEVMPCISPLGIPAKKMSLRETVMRKGVKADSRLPFDQLFFRETFDCPLTEDDAGELREALEMVRLAPSAVNKQPWRLVIDGHAVHFYEKPDKGYNSNGWDLQKIDLGIAMCHFAEVTGAELLIDDPGIACQGMEYIASFRL